MGVNLADICYRSTIKEEEMTQLPDKIEDSNMTAERAGEIAKTVICSEYEVTLALLQAYHDGWSNGYKEADKIVAVYQHRQPIGEQKNDN